MAETSDSIEFMAKYKGWMVIRKMTIYDNSTPQEIAFHLASIRQTLDKKAFEFLNIDTTKIDAYADGITKDSKKNFEALGETIQKLANSEAKKVLNESAAPAHIPIAKAYMLRKVVQNLGFDFDVNQIMLSKIYPDLKIKKPLGRAPKK